MNTKQVAAVKLSEYKDRGFRDILNDIYANFDSSDYRDYYALIYYKFKTNSSFRYVSDSIEELPDETKDLYVKVVMMFILTSGIRNNQHLYMPDYFKGLSKVYDKTPSQLIDYIKKQKIFNESDITKLFKASHTIRGLKDDYNVSQQIELYQHQLIFEPSKNYVDIKIARAVLYDYNLNEIVKLDVAVEYVNIPHISITTTNPDTNVSYNVILTMFYFDNTFKGFGANIYVKSDNSLNFNGYLVLPPNPVYSDSTPFWSYFKNLLKSEYKDMEVDTVVNANEKYLTPVKLKN
jgi:hypothetical protein